MTSIKSQAAFRTISEVADTLGIQQHVLRFWETKFPAIKPVKRGGNRRYYRPEDVALIQEIHKRLYEDGYTIRGVQKILKERGLKAFLQGGLQPGGVQSGEETPPVSEARKATADEAMPFNLAPAPIILAELKAIRAQLASAIGDV